MVKRAAEIRVDKPISEFIPQSQCAVCMSVCHELMSTGLFGGTEVLRGVPAESFSQLHTFNSEFNITDPGGHSGLTSLADETVPKPPIHTNKTPEPPPMPKYLHKYTTLGAKRDFTVTTNTVYLLLYDMAVTEYLSDVHTHTPAPRYALVSLSPYYIMRLNQSWTDYLSSSFAAKSHPIQTALSLFPALQTCNVIFIWSSYKHAHNVQMHQDQFS